MGTQITGRRLKVGDVVRAARSSPRHDGADRPLADMLGVVVRVHPKLNSGAMGKLGPHGKVTVQWQSGSRHTHDSFMIVKVDEPAPIFDSTGKRGQP